jgi:hypothetical protein
LRVGAGKARVQGAALEQQAFGQRALEGAVHRLLDGHQGGRRVGRDLGRQGQGFGQQLGVGQHARDQAVAVGLLGRQAARRQAHVHGLGLADGARQALRAAGAGQQGEPDLGQAEARARAGQHDVAGQGQLAAAAQGQAGDGGDDGLAHRADGLPVARDELAGQHVHVAGALHLGDVGAGGEGRSLPVSTMAPMSSRASKSSRAAPSASISASLSAFIWRGRFSRIRATRPWVSVSTGASGSPGQVGMGGSSVDDDFLLRIRAARRALSSASSLRNSALSR